jgi:hypothetical protein
MVGWEETAAEVLGVKVLTDKTMTIKWGLLSTSN